MISQNNNPTHLPSIPKWMIVISHRISPPHAEHAADSTGPCDTCGLTKVYQHPHPGAECDNCMEQPANCGTSMPSQPAAHQMLTTLVVFIGRSTKAGRPHAEGGSLNSHMSSYAGSTRCLSHAADHAVTMPFTSRIMSSYDWYSNCTCMS